MTPDLIELGKRAVACKGWRWLLGCRAVHIEYGDITTDGCGTYLGVGTQPGDMCVHWDDHAPRGLSSNWSSPQNFRPAPHVFDYCIPDLTDPATLGCLQALVREAYGHPRLVAIFCEAANPGQSQGWAVQCADNRLPVAGEDHPSEAEALVAALESAP